jgi:hypothetical protein
MPEGNPSALKIVRRKLYRNPITLGDSDVVLPHLSGDVPKEQMAVFELYSKLAIWKSLGHNALHLKPFALARLQGASVFTGVTLLRSWAIWSLFLGHGTSLFRRST